MSYSRVTTFSDGTVATAAQIEGNFKELRDWETEDIAISNVQVLSSDKIKKPEIVYQAGKAQLTINSTGAIASTHNPAVNFRQERPRNVSLTYNGCIVNQLHKRLNNTQVNYTYGREVPKTGILFYMEEAGSVRITYNIMVNAYLSSYDNTYENFFFIGCYAHDNGDHSDPVTPNPDVHARACYDITSSTSSNTPVEGDNIAGLRCITIHKCLNDGAGSSMLAKGWYHAALYSACSSRFQLVGANTAVVEAHYGVHVTVSDGVSI